MQYVLYILIALVILLLMIVIHELGHYVAGKILKFKINEFSIGFGPKLFSKTNKKTGEKFSVRLIPLGGYCAFDGEDESDETPTNQPTEVFMDDSENALQQTATDNQEVAVNEGEEQPVESKKELKFNDQKPWKRLIVLAAGAVFNFISAIIFSLIFILSLGYTVPEINKVFTDDNGVVYSEQLKVGDVVLGIEGKRINVMNSFDEIVSKLNVKQGNSYDLIIKRNGEEMTVSVKVQQIVNTQEKIDYVGMGFQQNYHTVKCSFGQALKYCVPYTVKLAFSVLSSLGGLITGSVPVTSMTGPVGTIGFIAEVGMMDARNFLILIPLLAANLAVFNLLPIPALDGSKLIFTTIEWIRGKPINRKVENVIHTVGIFALFAFVIVIDLIGLFT